jgi:hypothetical protein
VCALLSAALLAGWFTPPASSQQRKRKPVVVSFGQPNIWSLEQAHYLLARMHQENLDLRAKGLAALDPNETNATRINILRQLLQINAEFDQGIAVQNQRILRNNEVNDTRRVELTSERDRLRSQALQTQLDINRLTFERAKMDKDGSTQDQKDLKDAELKQRQADLTAINANITQHNDDITALGAQPSGTPTSPTLSATPAQLPSGLLDKLPADKLEKLFDDASKDTKLDATTRLDNYVQMQYEIIAKQLTLLRDEVGPGERLVFLELPQSVYTTPGDGDEKMAQSWWHVNGYTRTDPLLGLLLELYGVELRWKQIQNVPAYQALTKDKDKSMPADGTACEAYAKEFGAGRTEAEKHAADDDKSRGRVLRETFVEFQCEYENARERLFKDLFREARSDFARAQQGGARNTSQLVEAIRESLVVTSRTPTGGKAVGRATERENERANDADGEIRRSVKSDNQEMLKPETVSKMKNDLLCLLSDSNLELYPVKPDPKDPDPKKREQRLVQSDAARKDQNKNCGDMDALDFKKGIQYVPIDGRADRDPGDVAANQIERHAVRTVDIIPRQSSLNVNDIQETVKATGILAAFKFLFGFAGQVNFQRQREQFEEFIHQELYASGFGKGSRDFGWTFGAVPGTKRVAPGVRTTYAVLVVPDDAESLVLSASGCYFPRKSYEPLDFEDTSHQDWDRQGKFRDYNCGDEQTYIVPIPGGGDRSNFWVTGVDYGKAAKGKRATVSITGKNFSTQMGVLVNGVALTQVVGLAQPLLQARPSNADGAAPAATPAPCADGAAICGSVERIDPEQIVVTFTMPNDFEGIPTITLVAPGKSVDINWLPNVTVNGVRNVTLKDADFIFGERPKPATTPPPALSLTDFKVFSVSTDNRQVIALLTGTLFDEQRDHVYINGKEIEGNVPSGHAKGAKKNAGGDDTPDQNSGPRKTLLAPGIYRLVIDSGLLRGDKVEVTIVQKKKADCTDDAVKKKTCKEEDQEDKFKTASFPNPATLTVGKVTVLSYEKPKNGSGGELVIQIEGTGFGDSVQAVVEGQPNADATAVSPTQMVIKIPKPQSAMVIVLKDAVTGHSVKTVAVRPADTQ